MTSPPPRLCSAAAHELYDFQRVAVSQQRGGVLRARHDLGVALDRHRALRESELAQQRADGAALCDVARLAIHLNPHAAEPSSRGSPYQPGILKQSAAAWYGCPVGHR